MLRVEILDEHGHPLVIPCSRVVVREHETGTPVMVAAAFAQRGIMLSKATDPDFQKMLGVLHVRDTVLVTKLDASKLAIPEIR
jgi:hypothetical protein